MTAQLRQQESHRAQQKTDRSASLEDLRTDLRDAQTEFNNRNSLLQRLLRENILVAEQQLMDIRQIVGDADTRLDSLEQVLSSLSTYYGLTKPSEEIS